MLLPIGFAGLKPNFGTLLRAERRLRSLKQAALADDVGISRETLSRLERGRVPRMRTLFRLLHEFGWDISAVAVEGSASKALVFTEGHRGDSLSRAGADLAARRCADNRRSLRALAAKVGISPSTLSRIERGQSPHSRMFSKQPDEEAPHLDDRALKIASGKLKQYLDGAEFDSL